MKRYFSKWLSVQRAVIASLAAGVCGTTSGDVTITLSNQTFTGFNFKQIVDYTTTKITGSLSGASINVTLNASVAYTYADDLCVYVDVEPLSTGGFLQMGGFSNLSAAQRYFWPNGGSSAPGTTSVGTVNLTTSLNFSGDRGTDGTIWIGNGYGAANTSGTWTGTVTLHGVNAEPIGGDDTTPPTLSKGSIAGCFPTVAAAESAAILATTATDAGGTVTKTASTSGTCSAVVTVTGTDPSGNSATVSYNTRIDSTLPVVTLNGDSSVNLNCGDSYNDAGSSAEDDCDGSLTPTIAGTVGTTPGIYTLTYTAMDTCGNVGTATRTVIVVDTTDPVFGTVESGGTASADANCQAAVPDVVDGTTASDNCNGAPPIITQSPAAGTLVGLGVTTITLTATDAAGNTATTTTTFTVVDTTAPVFGTVEPGGTALADANCQALVPNVVDGTTATDNCVIDPIVPGPISGPVSGICNASNVNYSLATSNANSYLWTVPAGVTISGPSNLNSVNVDFGPGFSGNGTITVTAYYDYGSATSSITVSGAPDAPTLTPAVICPEASELYTASSTGATSYEWTLTGDDYSACTNPTMCSQYFVIWSVFGGSLSVRAINSCGTSSATTISGFSCIPGITGGTLVAQDPSSSAVAGSASGVTITQSPAAGTPVGLGVTTITLTATDAAGNTATTTTTFTVVDTTAPVFGAVEAGGTASAGLSCQAAVPNVVDGSTATDNCSTVTITQSPAAGTLVGLGVTTITLTATDAAGNTATTTTTFTVVDTTAPVFGTVEAGGTASAGLTCQAVVPNLVEGSTATDNCNGAPPIITQSPTAGTLVGLGVTTITLTATDAAGNTATATTAFTVEDTTPPTIICPTYPDLLSPRVVNKLDATASDNCGYTLSWTIDGADPGADTVTLEPGCHTIIWTATDAAGNSSTCTGEVRGTSNLSLAYTGDTMVFSSGPTVTKAKLGLGASVTAPGGTPNVNYSLLAVKFEVWTSAVTPSKVLEIMAPVNESGNAGALVELSTGSTTAETYEIRASLLQGTCDVGNNSVSGEFVAVDFGSTTRRVVGGGWISNAYSDNAKGTFGFVAGFTTKVKTALTGNSVFMLHGVKEGGVAYNWKVKDTSWSGATLSFYHNPADKVGTLVDSGRVTFKGVVQKINTATGAVVGGFGNATVVLDVFDGGLYTPARKDQYSIKVYDSNNLLWWGSTPATAPNPGLPLGGGGTGGGNIRIFSK